MVDKLQRGKLRKDELQEDQDIEKKEPFYKKVSWIIILLLAIMAVIAVVLFMNKSKNKQFESFEVISTEDYAEAVNNEFLPYKNGLIKYNHDGVEASDGDGNLLWNMAYDMKDPIAAVCKDSVAVADRGGNAVYISDGSSNVFTFEVIYPIVDIQVGNQGVVAIWTNGGMQDHIYLYGKSGAMLLDMATDVSQDGFPLDFSLSKDAKKLVTSYVSLQEGKLVNWVTFYNFSEVGENYVDKVVGSVSYESAIPEIVFTNNENVCIYRNDGFVLYKMKELPELIKEEKLNGEIINVFSNELYLGFIIDDSQQKQLLIYDMSGENILTKVLEEEYARAMISGDEIILYGNLSGLILRLNGSIKFHAAFKKEIVRMFPASKENEYFFIEDTKVERVSLTEGEIQ